MCLNKVSSVELIGTLAAENLLVVSSLACRNVYIMSTGQGGRALLEGSEGDGRTET